MGGASPGVVISRGGGSSSTGGQSATGGKSTADAGSSQGEPGTAQGGAPTTNGAACNNGLDDDGDGLVDGFDPECAGPLDQDEGSFATGIPGDNRDPKWQDCFFDGNSGAGDDGCRYPTTCLDGTLKADDPACAVTAACIDYCGKLTPNGCDCFGCCSVTLRDGSTLDIQETASCSLATIGDSKACPRCQKSTQCNNQCGECELCAGKTAADLPASCGATTPPPGDGEPPPPHYTCDNAQVCGDNLAACPADQYCSLGCCLPLVR
jgi:hypothetical protein